MGHKNMPLQVYTLRIVALITLRNHVGLYIYMSRCECVCVCVWVCWYVCVCVCGCVSVCLSPHHTSTTAAHVSLHITTSHICHGCTCVTAHHHTTHLYSRTCVTAHLPRLHMCHCTSVSAAHVSLHILSRPHVHVSLHNAHAQKKTRLHSFGFCLKNIF